MACSNSASSLPSKCNGSIPSVEVSFEASPTKANEMSISYDYNHHCESIFLLPWPSTSGMNMQMNWLLWVEYKSCDQKCDRVIPSLIASYNWKSRPLAVATMRCWQLLSRRLRLKRENSCGKGTQWTTLRKQRLKCKLLWVIKPSLQLGGTPMLIKRELHCSAEQLFWFLTSVTTLDGKI